MIAIMLMIEKRLTARRLEDVKHREVATFRNVGHTLKHPAELKLPTEPRLPAEPKLPACASASLCRTTTVRLLMRTRFGYTEASARDAIVFLMKKRYA